MGAKKSPDLTREVLLGNNGMSAHVYALHLGYAPSAFYRAIRRFGLHERYGLQKYAGS